MFCPRPLTALLVAVLLTLRFSGQNLSAQDPIAGSVESKLPSLELFRWSGDVNVPDPVAISFDRHGRAFVTQTQRRKSQDLDIRAHRDWIPHDVGLQSITDKRGFYHRVLAPVADENSKGDTRIQDLNGDGSHDYRDLMMISEKIHVIEDTSGDGTADRSMLFAEGFQTEVTGIAAGVLWHDGDVYATIAPDVWRLRDTNDDGQADQRKIIATGFGLHIAYAGHDMHGLTVGPDGRIYWTVGDKGISVTSQDGRRFHYPNQGGVMRCNPDGSDFEVFAHGLRNVQELAFDQNGNLFGVDNDADMPNERERVVYITPGMDAGWRCNYQYRGKDYNPWTAEKLWMTWHESQPAYITPPIAYSLNGPAGFAFNPGTALTPAYRNYFFLTGAPGGEQRAFQLKRSGASFRMINEHEIGRGIPLVGISFAPDGALYGVDWGGGYPLNQKGAVWKIDVPGAAEAAERAQTKSLLKAGFTEWETAKLLSQFAHADQRVRLGCQFELVKRRSSSELQRVALNDDGQLARFHAIWALGQLARSNDARIDVEPIRRLFRQLLHDSDSEIRAQAARTLGDLKTFDGKYLVPLLEDSDPRVQFHAAIALRNHPHSMARPALVRLAEQLKPSDTYLRHAISSGMSGVFSADRLAALASNSSTMVRCNAVLALRHQADATRNSHADTSTALAKFLNDSAPTVATEAALAIYEQLAWNLVFDGTLQPGAAQLAEMLPFADNASEAFVRRAIGASFLMGDPESVERVAAYASRDDAPLVLRLDALDALSKWLDPPLLDRVDGRRRIMSLENRSINSDRLGEILGRLIADPAAAIRPAALKAARSLRIQFSEEALAGLAALVSERRAGTDFRLEALNTLAAQKYSMLDEVLQYSLMSDDLELRIRALEIVSQDSQQAINAIDQILAQSNALRERQRAVLMLGQLETPAADARLVTEFENLTDRMAFPGTELELLEAAEARSSVHEQLAALVRDYNASRAERSKVDAVAEFSECLNGGDAATGLEIFMTHLTVQCIRCHRVGKKGSTVGPNLESIALKRDATHLLRSVIAPSADIEPRYRSQTLILDSGKVIQGLPLRKNDEVTVLANAQGKEVTVSNDEIDEVLEQKTSIMPEMTKALSRRDIRDLVAYLMTLRKPVK